LGLLAQKEVVSYLPQRNAAAQGIDLREITIKYEGLTDDELDVLRSHQGVISEPADGCALSQFPADGEPMYQEKATAVFSLSA